MALSDLAEEPAAAPRKTLLADVASLEQVDGVWMPRKVWIEDVRTATHTELVGEKVEFDVEIADRSFVRSSLERKGRRRRRLHRRCNARLEVTSWRNGFATSDVGCRVRARCLRSFKRLTAGPHCLRPAVSVLTNSLLRGVVHMLAYRFLRTRKPTVRGPLRRHLHLGCHVYRAVCHLMQSRVELRLWRSGCRSARCHP
jgi:hypothetical protein